MAAPKQFAMFETIRNLIRPSPAQPGPAIPAGQRVYAVGDIHGRCDLFAGLISAIEVDDAARSPAETTIILLGDLIDRGPDSAGVLALAQTLTRRLKLRVLWGNHEEMFLKCFHDTEVLRAFLRYGGRETILSYPLDLAAWHAATLEEAQVMMQAAVPAADLDFIRAFEDWIAIGDYLFVHAGIAPGVPLEQQSRNDLRWIREPFLSYRGTHEHIVVHGHTITDKPEICRNRIGIDTGAYRSGRLTALALEGDQRWLIAAVEENGTISCQNTPV